MSRNPLRTVVLGTLLAALGALLAAPPTGAAPAPPWLDHVRDATRQYKSLPEAKDDGYARFVDAEGIACIDLPGEGGMGIHFVNGELVGDGEVLAHRPEALVYDPTPQGLRLVALEYIVFKDAWRKEHPYGKPRLFGRTFELAGADNRFGIPPFYELHVWAWRHNPSGMFEDFNPRVTCP
jgi:hypothetical protein